MEDEPYRNVLRLLAFGLVGTGIYFCFGISI